MVTTTIKAAFPPDTKRTLHVQPYTADVETLDGVAMVHVYIADELGMMANVNVKRADLLAALDIEEVQK